MRRRRKGKKSTDFDPDRWPDQKNNKKRSFLLLLSLESCLKSQNTHVRKKISFKCCTKERREKRRTLLTWTLDSVLLVSLRFIHAQTFLNCLHFMYILILSGKDVDIWVHHHQCWRNKMKNVNNWAGVLRLTGQYSGRFQRAQQPNTVR